MHKVKVRILILNNKDIEKYKFDIDMSDTERVYDWSKMRRVFRLDVLHIILII